ncbi:MAG: phosphatidylserine decarboxylase [Proteobacteria bacterium]|nr:phosphatidylserine decarboxylase [Pseudomonadota bacterium]
MDQISSEHSRSQSPSTLSLSMKQASLHAGAWPKTKIQLRFLLIFTAIWASTPRWIHFALSRAIQFLCELRVSRFYIPLYCRLEYSNANILDRFCPASGAHKYRSFQDFFMRRLKQSIVADKGQLWPCDGVVCEIESVDAIRQVLIKGEPKEIRAVFGSKPESIPKGYYFTNIFLHNRDYHRIHTPVAGKISRIEHVPGVLFVLRPWAYESSPSLPALTNERINIDIESDEGSIWFLSIVGGPGVSTIILEHDICPGRALRAGEEIAAFAIGSTCCLASPVRIAGKKGLWVRAGEPILQL